MLIKKKLSKKVFLLDCTFRDGGYYNNWNFNKKLINKYFEVMQSIKIDFVEIGFRFIDKNKKFGPLAYTSDKFITSLNIPDYFNNKIAVMINASDFNEHLEEKINNLFSLKKFSKISLVRIATHYHEIKNSIKLLNILQKKGYQTALNLMQISNYSNNKIVSVCKLLKNQHFKVLYLADSLGDLDAQRLKTIVTVIKKNLKTELGVHCHDNLSNALANSQKAYAVGVRFIDSTLRGIGRGPGNLKTETAVPIFKENKNILNLLKLVNFTNNEFSKLEKRFAWGQSIFYLLSAMYKIHPTYIQNILADNRYDSFEILNVINYLKNKNSTKYHKINFNNLFYKKTIKSFFEPKNIVNNRSVLLIDNSLSKNKLKKTMQFIKKFKPFVLSLNFNNLVTEKLIDAYISCHPIKLLSLKEKFNKINNPIILPFNMLNKKISKYYKKANYFDYSFKEQGCFIKNKNYAIIPSIFVLSYALSFCLNSNCKKIFLAGFKGYKNKDVRNIETQKIFTQFNASFHGIKILSLFKNKYKLI